MTKTCIPMIVFFAVCIFVLPTISSAESELGQKEKLPLYEYGVVALGARLPHYRGSDEYENYAFPLPYFVYRGERVKADRDGVRTIFWRNKHFETDISMSGNPPVSGDNDAREGMPELDALGEIGPALRYYFYEMGERDSLFLQTNARAAFSVGFDDGFDVAYQGYVAELSLVYRDSMLFREKDIRFHLSTGLQYGDEDLHDYFYEVAPRYVTTSRARYDAGPGYSGFQVSGSILKELTPKIWASIYGRWMNTDGAVFADSPLVSTGNNYIIGTLFVWKIGESESRAR